MATPIDLRKNTNARIKAAEVLIQSGDYDTAIELLVLALECALKASVCKTLHLREYPDQKVSNKQKGENDIPNFFRTHEFDRLLLLSGLQYEFESRVGNLHKFQNWSTATTTWDMTMKYGSLGRFTKAEAERMLEALMQKRFGVISWIKAARKW